VYAKKDTADEKQGATGTSRANQTSQNGEKKKEGGGKRINMGGRRARAREKGGVMRLNGLYRKIPDQLGGSPGSAEYRG